jgi:phosphohistidine phosphatase
MFELMLMRHAKSDWHGHTADIERPLNDRGAQDAVRMGVYLNDTGLVPDRMIVSAARRTQQTAELLVQNMMVPESNVIVDRQLYLADIETLCELIELYAREDQRLLMLAHNPGMDYLVSYLASSPPSLSDSGKLMTTCALAYFHLDSLAALKTAGRGELQDLLRPREIPGQA